MATPIWKGSTNALVLQPNSPTFAFTDRVRVTDIYKGPQWLCASSMLARGTFGTGDRWGWVVNQCSVTNERGAIGTLTIEWEAGGSGATMPLPIGEVRLEPQELYPRIERNLYFAALLEENIKIANNAAFWTLNKNSGKLTDDPYYVALFGAPAIAANPTATPPIQAVPAKKPTITDPTQLALAQALFKKLIRGEETFYLAGWRYTSVFYSYTLPTLEIGAVIQSPNGIGPITINDNKITWLRLADIVESAGVGGSVWKITRTWLGGPNGHWDRDLYI